MRQLAFWKSRLPLRRRVSAPQLKRIPLGRTPIAESIVAMFGGGLPLQVVPGGSRWGRGVVVDGRAALRAPTF